MSVMKKMKIIFREDSTTMKGGEITYALLQPGQNSARVFLPPKTERDDIFLPNTLEILRCFTYQKALTTVAQKLTYPLKRQLFLRAEFDLETIRDTRDS
jgi:hypothetical protein